MLHNIIKISAIVFSVFLLLLGITELTKMIIQKAYRSKSFSKAILIIPLRENTRNTEYILRSIVAKIKWSGNCILQKAICLDSGISEYERKICETICNQYDFLELMNKDELYHYLEITKQNYISYKE